MTNLKTLFLNRNELTTIPSEISQLTHLQTLDLGDNKLKGLPLEIAQLPRLSTLYLYNNYLSDLPTEISKLINLQWLDISNNQLASLPLEIGQLFNLKTLYLRKNRLTVLPPEVAQISKLQTLDLSSNRLVNLPPEIYNLSQVEIFSLNDCDLTEMPLDISRFTTLRVLELSNNRLTTLSSEVSRLKNLQVLRLSDNQLTFLPEALRRLNKLKALYLNGNSLAITPELLGDGKIPGDPQAILDSYFKIGQPLREAKLLLVGEGSVGKTSLVGRLLHNQPPSDAGKTVGVDIHRWEVRLDETTERPPLTDDVSPPTDNRLRINVWDFGGQEIYHATHQFFLTHRSLYLVVIEARKDEAANRLDYWLRHVQSFAGDAPIILVVNKSDQGRLALDERGWMLKYPAIRAIVHTSCVSGDGLPQLRQAIESALAAMPHINDWIPLTWFEVKEQLAALDKDTLPYESYVELCQAAGIEHEAAQRTLARFLHDLGAALNFQDDRRLAGTHVLNPEWVTGGIYRILNAAKLQESGLLHLRDLDDILDGRRYPAHKHLFLLDIMGKFELSVPLDRERYLIPGLLPKARPAFPWPEHAPVALEYRYAILPAAILSRLMVRLHSHIWHSERGQPVRWRNGLVIHRDGCRALITADPAANRLAIALDGPTPQRRRLLAVVRAELAEIHASFAQLEAAEWVPIPDQPGKAIQYQALLNLETRGQATYYDAANDLEIDVYALLDGIEAPDERKARPLRDQLVKHFNMEELRQLCFDLHVDCEEWPDKGKSALARNLVLHFLKQGRLDVLARKVGEERPLAARPSIPLKTAPIPPNP
ncbi:MAG: leucine-rich repeat domain-containing protein [Anaerolinea sp.]|nr:leucine-rich repeat domain-containing protein [Anaerolinea sp.]